MAKIPKKWFRIFRSGYLAIIIPLGATLGLMIWGEDRIHWNPTQECSAGEISEFPRQITLTFSGDFMQHLPQVEGARRNTGFDYSSNFIYLTDFFQSADFSIINLETTLAERGFSGYPQFVSPCEVADAMQSAGIDLVCTANNHCCDNGARGIRNTIQYLDSIGMLRTGTFLNATDRNSHTPILLSHNGFRIAVLNYTYNTNGIPIPHGLLVNKIDTTLIQSDLMRCAALSPTHTVVVVHWGTEYALHPDSSQVRLSRWLHARGVDLVIGSHPHVVQPIELVRKDSLIVGVTAYSLGNFVSNQRFPNTDGGLSLRITLQAPPYAPTRYQTEYLLHWVHIKPESGRNIYYVIPVPLADSVLNIANTTVRSQYNTYVRAMRRLLANEAAVHEITHFSVSRNFVKFRN